MPLRAGCLQQVAAKIMVSKHEHVPTLLACYETVRHFYIVWATRSALALSGASAAKLVKMPFEVVARTVTKRI